MWLPEDGYVLSDGAALSPAGWLAWIRDTEEEADYSVGRTSPTFVQAVDTKSGETRNWAVPAQLLDSGRPDDLFWSASQDGFLLSTDSWFYGGPRTCAVVRLTLDGGIEASVLHHRIDTPRIIGEWNDPVTNQTRWVLDGLYSVCVVGAQGPPTFEVDLSLLDCETPGKGEGRPAVWLDDATLSPNGTLFVATYTYLRYPTRGPTSYGPPDVQRAQVAAIDLRTGAILDSQDLPRYSGYSFVGLEPHPTLVKSETAYVWSHRRKAPSTLRLHRWTHAFEFGYRVAIPGDRRLLVTNSDEEPYEILGL